MDLESIQRTGIAAAYSGGKILRKYFGKLTQIYKKGATDLVTQADLDSEKIIIAKIREKFPTHGIIAEETSQLQGPEETQWIIDPLDGTTNYSHGISIFAISIAFAQNKDILVGIVLNPLSGELFTAIKGTGAKLNGVPINVSTTQTMQDSLLATGFPYDLRHTMGPTIQRLQRCLGACRGIRRLGAAALDLCYVACGRFDGFWEQHLKPWDTAAGSLIAAEAGSQLTDFSAQPYSINKKEIVTSNGHIHRELLSLLRIKDR